jgi:hypothetical protein
MSGDVERYLGILENEDARRLLRSGHEHARRLREVDDEFGQRQTFEAKYETLVLCLARSLDKRDWAGVAQALSYLWRSVGGVTGRYTWAG